MHSISMNKFVAISALVLGALMFGGSAYATKVAGVTLDDTMMVGEQSLALNGAGIRKKLFIKLYVGSLYTAEASSNAADIVAADAPMAIRLNLVSNLLTRKKMVGALTDGFKNSTGGNVAPIQAGIDQLVAVLPEKLESGSAMTLAYEPGVGTHLMDGDKSISVIEGLEFKQALFGIWLSDKPAQKSLKKAMLGK
ncbi:MAG: hypothetical protein ACI9UN_003327 [Granulosicoccus sp.]|jgi:hypothetical protein